MEETPQRITFSFIKSNHFRVIHADGAWGGAAPTGFLQIAFYNERKPIPKEVTHEVIEGRIAPKDQLDLRISKEGFVREVEVDVVMSLQAAESFHKWLGEHIEILKGRLTKE